MKFPAKIRWYMSTILPVIVIVIYLKGYYDMFKDKGAVYVIPWLSLAVILLGVAGWITHGKRERK